MQDCAPPGTDLDDYLCVDGFCEWDGEVPSCDETVCPPAAGFACASVDGYEQCVIPCTERAVECGVFPGFECSGVTDDGLLYCVPPPCNGVAEGEPCEIAGVGQFGVCMDGVCSCIDDSQCTVEGLACNQ